MTDTAFKVTFGFYYLIKTQGKEVAYEVAKKYIKLFEKEDFFVEYHLLSSVRDTMCLSTR